MFFYSPWSPFCLYSDHASDNRVQVATNGTLPSLTLRLPLRSGFHVISNGRGSHAFFHVSPPCGHGFFISNFLVVDHPPPDTPPPTPRTAPPLVCTSYKTSSTAETTLTLQPVARPPPPTSTLSRSPIQGGTATTSEKRNNPTPTSPPPDERKTPLPSPFSRATTRNPDFTLPPPIELEPNRGVDFPHFNRLRENDGRLGGST